MEIENPAKKQCIFLDPRDIDSVETLEEVFKTHDWELVRKDGYSELSVVLVLRCKRCKAERVSSLVSIARRKYLAP